MGPQTQIRAGRGGMVTKVPTWTGLDCQNAKSFVCNWSLDSKDLDSNGIPSVSPLFAIGLQLEWTLDSASKSLIPLTDVERIVFLFYWTKNKTVDSVADSWLPNGGHCHPQITH
jgi:hypothetical protein